MRYIFTLATLLFLTVKCYPDCSSSWSVQGDFLYWRPSVDDTAFVIVAPYSTDTPQGTRTFNDFDFKPGFRIEGDYAFNCSQSLQARYTRFSADQNKTVSGANLWATVGAASSVGVIFPFEFPGAASSSLDLFHQNIEALFRQAIWQEYASNLNFITGVQYAYVRLNETITYTFNTGGPTGIVRTTSNFWGIGPEFGVDFNYALLLRPGTFSVVGRGAGAVLAGNTVASYYDFNGNSSEVYNVDEHTWRIVPTWNARLGLNYSTFFACCGVCLEIGYEFTSYIKALPKIMGFFALNPWGASYDDYHNFDAQGPYASLILSF